MTTEPAENPQETGAADESAKAEAASATDTSQSAATSSPDAAETSQGAAGTSQGAGSTERGPLALRRPLSGVTGERRHFTSRVTAPPPKPRGESRPPAATPAASATQPATTAPQAGTVSAAESATASEAPVAAESAPPAAPASTGGGPKGGAATAPPSRGAGGKKGPPAIAEPRPTPILPKPSRRDQLSPELEAELEAALGGKSLDSLLSPGAASAGSELTELDTRRSATIVRVHGDDVFFSLGGRHEGFASSRQFREPPEPGQTYDVLVKGFNEEEGLYELLIPGASVQVADWSDISEGSVVEAKITGANTGGLECEVNKLRGFIPISQISIYRVENTAEFVGQKMLCVVTEANPQRRNLVLSRRAMLEREKEDVKRKFFEELQVGQIREGTVRKIEDFGAFVDLGGADGLIHVSQMSWDRVKHPSEVLKEGQKVQVRVEKFDPQTGKIGLSLRSLQEHPWTNISSRFPVGATIKGTVTRLAKFGAFVRLAPGVEGLIHISELAHQRVNQVGNVVQEGQEVEVKILTVDAENQRIGLSLRATIAAPQTAKAAAEEEPETPPREPAVKKRPGPLKGGFDRPTGGEDLGLNW